MSAPEIPFSPEFASKENPGLTVAAPEDSADTVGVLNQKVEYIQVIHQEGELPLNMDKIYWFEKEDRQYFASTADKNTASGKQSLN